MSENYQVPATQDATRVHYNEVETDIKPVTLKEHLLSLRYTLQEHLVDTPITSDSEEEKQTIKALKELISPELNQGYQEIFRKFKQKTKTTNDHQKREFVDLESDEISNQIENWTVKLINEVRAKSEDFTEEDRQELEAQSWILFNAVAGVMNTKSIEKDGFVA